MILGPTSSGEVCCSMVAHSSDVTLVFVDDQCVLPRCSVGSVVAHTSLPPASLHIPYSPWHQLGHTGEGDRLDFIPSR